MKRLFAYLALAIFPMAVFAVPGTINYQGRLLDNNGIPVTGSYNFVLSIWSTASGTTGKVYQENHNAVAVDDGVYNFQIGGGTSQSPTWNPTSLFNTAAARYVELAVNGETLTPRHRLLSAPFTLQSGNSDALGGQGINYFGTAAQVSSLQNQVNNLQTQLGDLQLGMINICNASSTSQWSYKNNLCFGGTPQCKGLDFSDEDLTGVTLNNADCTDAKFIKALITNSTYNATDFTGADFSQAGNVELVQWGLNTICPDGFKIQDVQKDSCLGHLK